MYEQEENVRRSRHPNIASVIGYALFGLPFAGPGVFIAGNILTALVRPSSPPPDPGMLLSLVVLGGIGGVSWWVAYKRFRRWRAYAPSHLRLETAPVPLGKSTRARLEVRVPADEQNLED